MVEREGVLRLTLEKKREILLNNVFGVDLDPQAVEVAQLSLYLKLLEEETTASAQQHYLDFHEALLPSLNKNIIRGNSLVGTDILFGQFEFSGQEERKLAPMDFPSSFPGVFPPGWRTEHSAINEDNGFQIDASFDLERVVVRYGEAKRTGAEGVVRPGGFDAIVGNPPYVRMETFKPLKGYLKAHFQAHEERADFYTYFIERALSLISQAGMCSMIISNKFAIAKYGLPLRRVIADKANIHLIADFAGADVFKGATVRTIVLVLSRKGSPLVNSSRYVPVPQGADFDRIETGSLAVEEYAKANAVTIDQTQISSSPWQLTPARVSRFINKLQERFAPLKAALNLQPLFGAKTGLNEAFILDAAKAAELISQSDSSAAVIKPILFGRDIRRYAVENAGRHVIYLHPDKDVRKFPAILEHLSRFRANLEKRSGTQAWYELQQPAVGLLPTLAKPKIVYPIIAPNPRFALDTEGFLINDKSFTLPTDSKYLLGVLNSIVSRFYFAAVCARLEGQNDCYYEYRAQFVERFPVRTLDLSVPNEKQQHDRIVQFVEAMLDTHRQLGGARNEHDRAYYENKAAGLDRQIDELTYDLYGLTAEERALVAGN